MQGSLSKLRSWKLDHKSEDIRGWPVRDRDGRSFGRVAELVIDTDEHHVTEVVLTDGRRLPAHDLNIGDSVLEFAPQQAMPPASQRRDEGIAKPLSERPQNLDSSRIRERARSQMDGEDVVIGLVEEDVEFGKRTIDNGTTRVEVRVREQPFEHPLKLREEVVRVERRKVDRPLSAADAEARLRDESVQVNAVTEYPVTEKHARVVEEVVLAKKVEERAERLRETIRRTSVDVHELGTEGQERTLGATP